MTQGSKPGTGVEGGAKDASVMDERREWTISSRGRGAET